MDRTETFIRRAGGVCSAAEFARAGVTSRQIASAVGARRLVRLRRGIYAQPDAPPGRVEAARLGARLAGLSAAATYGLWGGWDRRLHVAVPRNASDIPSPSPGSGLRVAGQFTVVVHWGDRRRQGDSCWRVSLEDCVGQVLRWHDSETAQACVESALTTGLLTEKGIDVVTSGLPVRVARLAFSCVAGAQSGLETIVRVRLEASGFVVVRQATVRRVGHVDLRIAGTRVIIEVDGYSFHSGREPFAEDRRRDAEAAAQGLVCLRFTAGHVQHEWEWMERMIVSAVLASSS